MTDPNSTIKKLAEITDAALFERLATDVLRSCKPSLYENLSHPGVNSDGKTVKAPLDGIGWVRDTGGDRVIAAAHSTDRQSDIRKKWLHDPSAVIPRKTGGKPTAPEGDLHKAIREIGAFRANKPHLQATFALTSNREPDKESIVAAQKLATDARIDLDIWSASRIAQYLDSAEGQWTRKIYLGDSVEFVSTELLQSCVQRCLFEYAYMLNSAELVDRNNSVEQSSGHTLLVGSSGVGKTTIALQILKRHAEDGGTGLVIPHETVILATSLAEAIDIELRKLEPYLQPNSGHQALSLATESLPFVVVIEDVNAASDSPMVLNKMVGWVLSGKADPVTQWRLVCPVWPQYVDSLEQKLKDTHGSMMQAVDVYTDEQAEEAIRKKSLAAGCKLLPATVSSIAKALGNDPLLIALYDFSSSPDAAKVVETYVEKELEIVASNSANLHRSDVKDAVDSLVRHMLAGRRLNPSLREIKDWFRQESEQLQTLRLVFKSGSVLRLAPRNGEDILTPRHDRVLLSLFSCIMGEDLRNGSLSEGYLIDPFYSEAVGSAILSAQLETDKFGWLMQANPLSLFHAFHLATKTVSTIFPAIVQIIRDWLSNMESHGERFRSVRFRALQILAATDAPEVFMLTDLFPIGDQCNNWCQARFRNGDIGAGLRLLTMYDSLGVQIQGRRELLSHIFARFGTKIIEPLQNILTTQNLDDRNKKGSLLLAGYLGDSALASAIRTSWFCDNSSDRNLVAYLWATARCWGDDTENTLELVCDAWAELPEDEDRSGISLSRNSLAAYGLSWEFRNYPPLDAIPYFVQRASSDDRLEWPITYMLRDCDHPVAIEHIVKFLAERDRNSQPDTYSHSANVLLNGWKRRQREHGIRMSVASKTRLIELAFDPANDLPLRKSAFRVWEVSKSPGDLDQIWKIDKTSDLYEKAIWARVRREDKTVIPQLIELIPTNPLYWWQAGRYLWSAEMTEALHRSIKNVADCLKANHDTETYLEWILSERLMEVDQRSAEQIILQEWEGLKYSPLFVQAALYCATPQLLNLAKDAIEQAIKPAELLNHVTMHMGCMTQGRTGITRFEQVRLLCDYADLLSEHDIYTLWEICNERGWIEFRRTYLDDKLAQTEHFGKRISNTIDFSDLDKAIEGKLLGATSFWVENHIRDGKTLLELMDGLFGWLDTHRTVRALKIIFDIFHSSARRCDLERLQRYTETWPETAELMADLAFSIKHRTLN
jgi:hypothetical protein